MKGKTLIYVGVYAAVVYGAYYMFFSKNAYAKKIIMSGMYARSINELKTFDMAYLRAWSKSASKNEPTFTYKGKVYLTKGGSAKK